MTHILLPCVLSLSLCTHNGWKDVPVLTLISRCLFSPWMTHTMLNSTAIDPANSSHSPRGMRDPCRNSFGALLLVSRNSFGAPRNWSAEMVLVLSYVLVSRNSFGALLLVSRNSFGASCPRISLSLLRSFVTTQKTFFFLK